MTTYSEDDVSWISNLTAFGVRLNDAKEWTMSDKLLAPMQLYALYRKRDSTPREEDRADVYLPIDKEELQPYIPSLANGWTLPCINFKTDMRYKLHLDEFRKAYVQQYEICNKFPDKNQMAAWETILKYWRQAARFFLCFWAMHNDLEKLDAVRAAIDIIGEKFFQHNDLEKYCDNILLPYFKQKMPAKPSSREKRARSYEDTDSSYRESESSDESDKPKRKSGCRDKPKRKSGCRDESSEGSNPNPDSSGVLVEADEIAKGDDSANDSSYDPSEDKSVSLPSSEGEMENGDLYDLDDDSAIDNRDYEGEKQLELERKEAGLSYKVIPFATFIDCINQQESESSQDESEECDEVQTLGPNSDDEGTQQKSYAFYGEGGHYCVKMFSCSEGAIDPTELDEPGLDFKLNMSDLYSNIRHFVDHLVVHGLVPPGMTGPTMSNVKITMKACGMHVEEKGGTSDQEYVNSYASWVPAYNLDNFPKYMSSFREICCNDSMVVHRLGRKQNQKLRAREISRHEIDERIDDYFEKCAPPSVKGQNWQAIICMLRGVNEVNDEEAQEV